MRRREKLSTKGELLLDLCSNTQESHNNNPPPHPPIRAASSVSNPPPTTNCSSRNSVIPTQINTAETGREEEEERERVLFTMMAEREKGEGRMKQFVRVMGRSRSRWERRIRAEGVSGII
jgi:hypothetical protein